MDGSEASIAAAGGEDVWLRASGKLFKAAEDVIANSSAAQLEYTMRLTTNQAYRDLKDPEGCRFSSLRKTLLLRFRILLT